MSSASLSSADTAVSPSRSFSIDDEEAAMNMNGGLHPAIHIMNWIFFSNLTILFNKWIIGSTSFKYHAQVGRSCRRPLDLVGLGVADPSLSSFINVLVIVAGVAIASVGEIHFSLIGFLYQLGGIGFEAVRVIMIQVMLSGEGLKMDPLVGLYYYAPVCAVMNVIVALPSEVPHFRWDDLASVGFGVLFLNALIAFMLNVASVFLIGKTSGLVMTLTGIFKNILLIIVSVIIWHTKITLLQAFGYTIALGGLTYYSVGYDQIARGGAAVIAWTAATISPFLLSKRGLPHCGPQAAPRRRLWPERTLRRQPGLAAL
ncbi:hypothetical protein ACCO45_008017 [Purpureocillium lilacinum]|uniref:Uncharacterized protein n=1 Tax=Purpureocillium lilacinum TaxID=33203 RepID=A0ACC4DMB1_PURLI